MVDAVVTVFLEKLLNTLTEESRFVNEFGDQFQRLQSELQLMQCFLKDAERHKRKSKNETLRQIMADLRELIYEAEDILVDCQLQSENDNQLSNGWLTCFSPSNLHFQYQTGKRLREINEKITLIKGNITSFLNIPLFNQTETIDAHNLEHPSTFDTLAIDPDLKKTLIEDLDRFVTRKDFYKEVGKAWKRGYLLYGPPGTGKSSLIAAMANYLRFDIYDLELTSIYSNSDLRRILLSTTNRSILVIEDIDCSSEMQDRQNGDCHGISRLTLSGILNFVDGLWSSCGDERIIVLTTNHKDRLDPALLRPGRMDMHIHMSYCTVNGFKILASNYLGIEQDTTHSRSGEIEGLLEITEVTPAEVAGELMKSDDADAALGGLVNFLKRKRIEENENKNKENEATAEPKQLKTDDDEKKPVRKTRRTRRRRR